MMKQKIWRLVRPMVRSVVGKMIIALFYLLRAFPIQKNKVVASAFIGRRYGDNQKYMMEELHKLCPEADIVWVKDSRFGYELPEWIRPVRYRSFRWLYDYATAKIWTDNCTLPEYLLCSSLLLNRKSRPAVFVAMRPVGMVSGVQVVFSPGLRLSLRLLRLP